MLIIGESVLDFTIHEAPNIPALRLGGVVHAARGLWAMGVNYDCFYFAPSYQADHTEHYLREHGCRHALQVALTNFNYWSLKVLE